MKRIYIKEFDIFGWEIDVEMSCSEDILKAMDIEWLENLKETAFKKENYEVIDTLNKIIKEKKNG